MDAIVFPPVLIGPLLPTLVVLVAAALVLVLDVVPWAIPREVAAMVALAGMIGALLATLARWSAPGRAFRDMVVLDNFALFFNVVICYAGALIVLLSMDYLRRTGSESSEYWALVLFATAGMMLLACSISSFGVANKSCESCRNAAAGRCVTSTSRCQVLTLAVPEICRVMLPDIGHGLVERGKFTTTLLTVTASVV